MRFSAEYLSRGRNTVPEEAATVAELRIDVADRCATDARKPGAHRTKFFVVVPTYPIAEGIALRWWTLVAGRGREISLRSMRAGFALPDLRFRSDGQSVSIRCEPFTYENPPLEFVTQAEEELSVATFEAELRRFVCDVVEQLRSEDIPASVLSERWTRISESQADAEERSFCEAAGALDIDPYTCSEADAALIQGAGEIFGGEGLLEFLAGSQTTGLARSIDWARAAEAAVGDYANLPALRDLRGMGQALRAEGRPWLAGYRTAQDARQRLGLEPAAPIATVDEFGRSLGNAGFRAVDRADANLRAMVSVLPDQDRVFAGQRPWEASTLFALARAVGDITCFGERGRFPVMEADRTRRQQVGRAFAAEFLAPGEAVTDMRADGKEMDEIATHFGVSEELVQRQVENYPQRAAA